jgi:phage terminase small subunit
MILRKNKLGNVKLTLKQKAFIADTVKYKNATKSALKNYDVKNKQVARVIASENLSKPYIKKEIDRLMEEVGYNPKNSLSNLIAIEQAETKKITGSDKIKASEMLLKLSGYLVEKKQSINMNIDTMDNGSLIRIKEKYSKIISK